MCHDPFISSLGLLTTRSRHIAGNMHKLVVAPTDLLWWLYEVCKQVFFAMNPAEACSPLKPCTKGSTLCTHAGVYAHVMNCKMRRCEVEGTGREKKKKKSVLTGDLTLIPGTSCIIASELGNP